MRLLKSEVDKRIDLKIDKSIKSSGVNGVLNFGLQNDYPQLIERIISSSITAKSVSEVYMRFLVGEGFSNDAINNIVIGKTDQGKQITIKSLLRQVCQSISIFNGAYIHVNITLDGKIVNAKHVPFKFCRFSKPDDVEYSAKIGVYPDWSRENPQKRFDKNEIAWYNVYNEDTNAIVSQINKAGGIENYNGQIYFHFLDTQFNYPLSPFDATYLDCDSEYQISLFKNRQLRNGMLTKTVFRVLPSKNEEEAQDLANSIKSFMGVDGETSLIIEDEVDANTGQLKPSGSMIIDKIPTNVDDKLFESWQKELTNNIRKSVKALPAILIDYEESKLGTTSGEAITQATNFYNAVTRDDRDGISATFKEIFSKSVNPVLAQNTDWEIKEISLYNTQTNVNTNV